MSRTERGFYEWDGQTWVVYIVASQLKIISQPLALTVVKISPI
jgi:hypothetical protein